MPSVMVHGKDDWAGWEVAPPVPIDATKALPNARGDHASDEVSN